MAEVDLVETCIIGAGVVGLAVARQLALDGQNVIVLERNPRFGEGVSSRNSEVIHAGIYYPKDSLKARLCVRGKALLYDYCVSHNIQHRAIGKLIIATCEEEELELESIFNKAIDNGVTDLAYESKAQLKTTEPNVHATLALMSPSTGIVDSHGFMTALLGDLESEGGMLACQAKVTEIRQVESGFIVVTTLGGEEYRFGCRNLINAAGLGAQQIANSIEGFDKALIPRLHLCRGNYFLLQGKNPFCHLIYPVPEPSGAGLGVHATIDIGGQVKFGPDVEYIDKEDYEVSEKRLPSHYKSIRRYLPQLEDNTLTLGYAGIRPKLQGPGEPPADFVIQSDNIHQVSGLINLFGIESPGLTSSLAIAETVSSTLNQTQK